ncbi:DUF3221 domain-containing protein [Ureibacillus manganicus]|uniref:DUF3221 domain-containing protein n=1 Tax=Ureibacillus manganicus DSM 26584 TaxID=1384049 RepID=A0A0A3I4D6_9BACL|nr:DUF3221 domain-containing protein [Ureibacillus manganicus]KGR78360.1 hypothetical protein CD29_11620 [Ureibacillus manganicus DSM 26584]
MKLNKWILLFIIIFSITVSFIAGYYVGKHNNSEYLTESFYANVLNNDNGTLHLGGIPENDINHRGEFTIAHKNIDEVFNNHLESINVVDLPKGSQIRVIYDGMVMESYPAQITHVLRIEQIE